MWIVRRYGAVKLEFMAREMRKELGMVQRGWLHQQLMRSLHIVLERNGEQWRLALGREKVFPSAVEAEICQDAFQVPQGTELLWIEPTVRGRGHRRYKDYFLLEMRWREVDGQAVDGLCGDSPVGVDGGDYVGVVGAGGVS